MFATTAVSALALLVIVILAIYGAARIYRRRTRRVRFSLSLQEGFVSVAPIEDDQGGEVGEVDEVEGEVEVEEEEEEEEDDDDDVNDPTEETKELDLTKTADR